MNRYRRFIMCLSVGVLLIASLLSTQSELPVITDRNNGIPLPILMYHSIVENPSCWSTYVISPSELERDLNFLQANGYQTVTVRELINYVDGNGQLPDKPILLTFDDGYYNNYLYAYPLLQQYCMKAVLSPVGRYADQYSLSEDFNPEYAHATWVQLREMSDAGVMELQNHSYNMHTITSNRTASMKVSGESAEHYRTALVADAIRMQALMDSQTGRLPEAYTYPFGLVSNESISILKEMGFRATLSCSTGINYITDDPKCLFLLKRYLRPHGKAASTILP